MSADLHPDHATLARLAAAHGFEVVGVTSAEPLHEDLRRLQAWAGAGHEGDLGWMTRDPPQRADPRTLLRDVRTVVSVAVAYPSDDAPFHAEQRYGRVARYAWGRDYHDLVLPRLEALARALTTAFGGRRGRGACDHSPLLERAMAARAGLGFVGKNTCLILPRGSWWFLGEVLLDVDVPPTPPPAPTTGARHCGTCTSCLVACPTAAFPAPYVLDARRCISYLTIEQAGVIPAALREDVGAWVFGCDVCQEVCPFNRFHPPVPWPELRAEAGVGGRLDLVEVLDLVDDAAFAARFGGTALSRPGRVGLQRNAALVARNVGAHGALGALRRHARHAPEAVLRAQALDAWACLDPDGAREALRAARGDPAAEVRAEAEAHLAGQDAR